MEFKGKWEPIETAPKDGTDILVYNGDWGGKYITANKIGVASWSQQVLPNGKSGWIASDDEGVMMYKPTHWMPLPEEPSKAEAE
jgi:hypothetical protein